MAGHDRWGVISDGCWGVGGGVRGGLWESAAAQPAGPFCRVRDPREPAKVRYSLAELLLLVVAASICICEDNDEIVERGETHLNFLRRFLECHFGIPGAD